MDKKLLIEMTAEIVSAHASMNQLTKSELEAELKSVFAILNGLAEGEDVEIQAAPAEVKPVMPVDAAFSAEKVFCLLCGKGFTTLKKHLRTSHQMEPRGYRKMFGIPASTALVARSYSESKKQKALSLGLADKLAEGRKKRAAKKAQQ